MSQLTQS